MGTWAAYLAFRSENGAGRDLFPDLERYAAAVPGWTYLSDEIENVNRLEAALADTHGPALLSAVCDSDYAGITGYLNSEQQWTAYINQDTAAALDEPTPALQPAEDDELLDRITIWAQAAEAPPVDRDRLRTLFATHYLFADDGLLALEQLLGVVSPKVRPFNRDLRSDYEIGLFAPAGETVTDEAISQIERVIQGEAEADDPQQNGHRVMFHVPKTHEPALAVPAFTAVLRQLAMSPATLVWDARDEGSPRWKSLAELE